MLTDGDSQRIVEVVAEAWEGHSVGDEFRGMFRGKERGHRIADYVEEKTVDCLEAHFDIAHEVSGGARRARGMGDAWVKSNGMYNPVNVKAGVHGVGGQPNMVSLAKLTVALLDHQVDSYYLLLVKFSDEDDPKPDVQLVDILHYIDFLHFDSGTGQLMLRADRFAQHMAAGGPAESRTLEETVDKLVELRRDGDRRLVATRQAKLDRLERKLVEFDPSAGIDQTGMSFG